MTPRSPWLALLCFTGCTPEKAPAEPDADSADTAADTDTALDTATETGIDAEPSVWEGEFNGTASLTTLLSDASWIELCASDIAVTVDASGQASADRVCAAVESSNPEHPFVSDVRLMLIGQIAADNRFLGTMEQTGADGATETCTMTGSFSTGGVGLFWSGTLLDQRGAETDVEGTIVLWGS